VSDRDARRVSDRDARRVSDRDARRVTSDPLPSRDAYFDGWSALHGGFDPRSAFWPRFWLGMTYVLGRPLAALRVAPDVVTVAGLIVTASALPVAAAGGRWPLLAVVVVVASGLLDNLDGCVAVLTGRASRWGYVVDSLADRVCDALYLLTLWLAGAPAGLCVAAGGAVVLLEYGRARATGAGFDEIGMITVGERPTRIVVTCFGLAFAGILPDSAGWCSGAGAAATLGVALVGAGQYLRVARRSLLAGPSGGTDEPGDGGAGQGDQR
jgi:CDP-diacylglycerol--glycerol-3-phosphate 3-phosphatidyltransferase